MCARPSSWWHVCFPIGGRVADGPRVGDVHPRPDADAGHGYPWPRPRDRSPTVSLAAHSRGPADGKRKRLAEAFIRMSSSLPTGGLICRRGPRSPRCLRLLSCKPEAVVVRVSLVSCSLRKMILFDSGRLLLLLHPRAHTDGGVVKQLREALHTHARPWRLCVSPLGARSPASVFPEMLLVHVRTSTASCFDVNRFLGKAQAAPETLDARLYLHYEFPPYCVNETGRVRVSVHVRLFSFVRVTEPPTLFSTNKLFVPSLRRQSGNTSTQGCACNIRSNIHAWSRGYREGQGGITLR